NSKSSCLMENYQTLIPKMEEVGGVMTTKELHALGWSNYHISQMVKKKIIERIKRGLYRLVDGYVDQYFETMKIVPEGVICLFSAALIHDLSTFLPQVHQVSISKERKVSLPNYPPIKLHYWNKSQYSLGIEEVTPYVHPISIYSKEKTVCDFVKFRNKVGMDSMKEVLRGYLRLKDRDLSKLLDYAKELHVYSIIDNYLDVLV
ncbi:MAG: type IV toxin-antitoxin system AbiEi family antitoxin domain-containing protein, partial [Chitinophagales bacterium]